MDKRIYLLCALLLAPAALSQDEDDMKKWNDYVENYAKPGPEHEPLKGFLGEWDLTITLPTMGLAEKGKATYRWQVDGSWLACDIDATFLGRPAKQFILLGYDRFAHKYVGCSVSSTDTQMIPFRGDRSRDGKSIVVYGQMHEPMTGEIAKAVKYAYRIQGPDEHAIEVHDLAIGEDPDASLVMVYTFKRRK